MKAKPFKFTKGNTTYVITEYGSYVNDSEYGMVQEKNAMNAKELLKHGYKPHYS